MEPARAALVLRAVAPDDLAFVVATLRARWGATGVARRGRLDDAATLPGVVALASGAPVGLATYRADAHEVELVTLDALERGAGVGTALLDRVVAVASDLGARRLWLVTTNDNLEALAFYQRRGLRLVAVHVDAVREARARKPEIPLVGAHGIPLRDELELELVLQGP